MEKMMSAGIQNGLYLGLIAGLLLAVLSGLVYLRKKKKNQVRENQNRERTKPAPVMLGTSLRYAVHQDIGKRSSQEDSYGISELSAYKENGVLALVADGIGGLDHGAEVSSALVYSFLNFFRLYAETEPADMLLEMAAYANAYISQMLQGMGQGGSTLVCALVREGKLYFLTVGDSRLYLHRDGLLILLNREHTVQEKLVIDAINNEIPIGRVTSDWQARAVTSYFGIGTIPYADRNADGIRLKQGDKILLLSDGVFGTIAEEELEAMLQDSIADAVKKIGEKIRRADKLYQDNSTALVLEYLG